MTRVTTERHVIDGGCWKQVYHSVLIDGVEVGTAFEHEGYVNFESGHHGSARFATLEECTAAVARGKRRFSGVVRLSKALARSK